MTASITAMRYIIETLQNVLPPGTPPSWQTIEGARWVGHGKHRRAHADLIMFDGKHATVEAWNSKGLRAHRWTDMPGGDCSFEGGRWIRIDRDTLEPQGRLATLTPPATTCIETIGGDPGTALRLSFQIKVF